MSDEQMFRAIKQYEQIGEIVTCEECRNYKPYSHGKFGICLRSDNVYEIEGYETVEPTDYCSRGMRKDCEIK